MEKKRKQLYKTFTRWSLSYIVISLVAIIAFSFSAFSYSRALRKDLDYINAVQLEMTQLRLDQRVKSLRAFGSRTNLNPLVTKLRQAQDYDKVPRYELYELVRDLATAMLLDKENESCYLYFPNIDLMMSGSYYNQSREFCEIAFDSYDFVYEDFYQIISQEYKNTQIFSLPTQTKDRNLTVLVRPLDSSSRQKTTVNAVMVLNMAQLSKPSSWLTQSRDQTCVIDRGNGNVIAEEDLDSTLKEQILNYVLQDKEQERNGYLSIGNSVISVISSQYENWDYVVITREQPFISQLTNLQRLAVTLLLSYLILSATVIGYAVLQNWRPLKRAMDVLEKQGKELGEEGNVFYYIDRSVQDLVAKNRAITGVVSRQRQAIRRELLHRLLTEKVAAQEIDADLMKQCGISLEENNFALLAYRIEKEDFPSEQENSEISWFILQNVTEETLTQNGFYSLCSREGSRELVFLVWSRETDQKFAERIRDAIDGSTGFVRKYFSFSYRMAVSEIHEGVSQVHAAYREISAVFLYQKKEDRGSVVEYGQINLLPTDTLLNYPVDMENRLSQCIRGGDAKGACATIRELFEINEANCQTPEAIQFLASNIVGSLIRAGGRDSRDNGVPISQNAIMEEGKQGDVQRLQDELEQLASTVCKRIAERCKKDQESQRGRFCQEICQYVERHFQENELGVNSIAEHFQVRPAYLSRVFQDMQGEKLSQYIAKFRLERVKERLLSGERIEEAAAACGFGSHRTFLRIFKQYEGLTPTQFKELEDRKKGEENRL